MRQRIELGVCHRLLVFHGHALMRRNQWIETNNADGLSSTFACVLTNAAETDDESIDTCVRLFDFYRETKLVLAGRRLSRTYELISSELR